MNLKYTQEINQWINKNRESILENWIELAKIPSIEGAPESNAPFGNECAKVLEKASEIFESKGFPTNIYSDSGYALISHGEGEKTIGIFSHGDVVPVGEDWLYTKPFEPIIKDGALIGRGVEDNKSGIMAAYCALNFIKENNVPISSRLQLFIGSNEETGMKDIDAFVKEQSMPDVSIVPDADFPCSTGEKGILHFWGECSTKANDILDFEGGQAFNVVLDKAKAVLKNTPEIKAEIEGKIKGNDRISVATDDDALVVEAKGIAKHACEPDGSVNAAFILAELLSDISAISASDRKIMSDAKHILSCPYGSSMGLEYSDELFGRLTFVNGMARLDEGKLALSFDMRYSSKLDKDVQEEKTRSAFSKLGWEMQIASSSAGFSIDDKSPVANIFEDIYERITGIRKKSIKLGGGTYARKLKNAFSVGTFTETSSHTTPILEMPPGHGGAHQCDEMIDIESFFDAVKIIIQYILALDEIINR